MIPPVGRKVNVLTATGALVNDGATMIYVAGKLRTHHAERLATHDIPLAMLFRDHDHSSVLSRDSCTAAHACHSIPLAWPPFRPGTPAPEQPAFLCTLIFPVMAKTETNTPSSDRLSLPAVGYSLLLAVLVAYGLHALFISDTATRDAAQKYLERTIADEDREFCETFGMRSTSAAFTACSRELAITRQKQIDRDNAAAQGVL
ncbi:hypothetical protein [Bradyrhizobium sp. McL0616]|uniref:hypothetical protein n=1 Tax=Bradyrhizobium sp. McL0616 TaxID=3415674 RepID=UPI003CED8428